MYCKVQQMGIDYFYLKDKNHDLEYYLNQCFSA